MNRHRMILSAVLFAGLIACTDTSGPDLGSPSLNTSSAFLPGLGASISLESTTNGVDADEAPGPSIPVGEPVVWEYTVTNIGTHPVSALQVDDSNVGLVCFILEALDPGHSASCTRHGTAQAGGYTTMGTVTALSPSFIQVSDPSHYTGEEAGEEVEILLKPGSDAPCMNASSRGRTPVAILASAEFDPREIDPATVVAGESTEPVHSGRHEDVNGDGLPDLMIHFKTQALNAAGLLVDGELLVISGQTYDGESFSGSALVRLVGGPFCR